MKTNNVQEIQELIVKVVCENDKQDMTKIYIKTSILVNKLGLGFLGEEDFESMLYAMEDYNYLNIFHEYLDSSDYNKRTVILTQEGKERFKKYIK